MQSTTVDHLGRKWTTDTLQDKRKGQIKQDRAFCELVPWMMTINQSLVVNKDGSIFACFEFDGLDTDSSTDAEVNVLATHLENAMRLFQNHPVVYWWQVHRRVSKAWPRGEFANAAARKLDVMRKQSMSVKPQYSNTHVLTILLQPPSSSVSLQQKLTALASEGGSPGSIMLRAIKQTIASFNPFGNSGEFAYPDSAHLDQVVEDFERLLGNFCAYVPEINFKRLTGSTLGAYLHKTVGFAGLKDDYKLPDEQSVTYPWLDELMPHNELEIDPGLKHIHWSSHNGRDACVTGHQSVRAWRPSDNKHLYKDSGSAEQNSGGGTHPGMLDDLLKIDSEMIVTMVVKPYLPSAAQRFATSMRKFHRDRRLGLKALFAAAVDKSRLDDAPMNTARVEASLEANHVVGKTSIGQLMLCDTWIGVSVIGRDAFEVTEGQKAVEQAFAVHGFDTITEGMHGLCCYQAQMPGNHYEIVRWIPVTANNIADVAFSRTLASGQQECKVLTKELQKPCDAVMVLPTSFNTAYFLDIFKAGAGHGMLVGPSRTGKTVLAMLLASSFTRYPGAQVFCLDKDFSCRITVLTHGGRYLNLDPESQSEIQCNPFALMENPRHHEWLKNFTVLLAEQRGYVCTADDVNHIATCIGLASQRYDHQKPYTLQRVYDHMVKEQLKNELKIWVEGSLKRYFNNEIDGFELGQITGFELGQILSDKQVAVPFTEMIFYRIDQHLVNQIQHGDIRPTLIFIPEVWHLLANPRYAYKLVDWLKTLGKRNCALWMDTQSLEDANEEMSTVFAAIRDNVKNMIFTANRAALSDSAKRLYMREFGLREEQLALIANGIPKRDYVLRQDDVVCQVQLALTPQELAMLRSELSVQKIISNFTETNQSATHWLDSYIQEVSQI
jgi:type IV secretion system protein VirB4